jgi:hypothetical protein
MRRNESVTAGKLLRMLITWFKHFHARKGKKLFTVVQHDISMHYCRYLIFFSALIGAGIA